MVTSEANSLQLASERTFVEGYGAAPRIHASEVQQYLTKTRPCQTLLLFTLLQEHILICSRAKSLVPLKRKLSCISQPWTNLPSEFSALRYFADLGDRDPNAVSLPTSPGQGEKGKVTSTWFSQPSLFSGE